MPVHQLSLPREKVLIVPNRNVLLTGSGWGGGKRSPSDDPEGPRPIGRVEEGTKAFDHAAASSRGVAANRAAYAAAVEEAEGGGRSGRAARATGANLQSATQRKEAGESRADSLAR